MSNRVRFRNVIKTIVAVAVVVTVTGCASSPSDSSATSADVTSQQSSARLALTSMPNAGAYTYHHWPEANVYFDPQRDVFFWMEGNRQQTGPDLPATLMDNLGGAIVVQRDTANPLAAASNPDDFAQVEMR